MCGATIEVLVTAWFVRVLVRELKRFEIVDV